MSDHITWYKDEATWCRFKDLCEDKDQFGSSYKDWVTVVQRKIDDLALQGISLVKMDSDPEKFASWCKENGHPLNGKYRGLYLAHCFTGDAFKH